MQTLRSHELKLHQCEKFKFSEDDIIRNIKQLEKIKQNNKLENYLIELHNYLTILNDDCFTLKIINEISDQSFHNLLHFAIMHGGKILSQILRLTPGVILDEAFLTIHNLTLSGTIHQFHLSLFKSEHSDQELIDFFNKLSTTVINTVASTFVMQCWFPPKYDHTKTKFDEYNFLDLILFNERSKVIIHTVILKLTPKTLIKIFKKTSLLSVQIPTSLLRGEEGLFNVRKHKCYINKNFTFNENTIYLIDCIDIRLIYYYLLSRHDNIFNYLSMFNTKLLNHLAVKLAQAKLSAIKLIGTDALKFLTDENMDLIVSQGIGAYHKCNARADKYFLKSQAKIKKHIRVARTCYFILLNNNLLNHDIAILVLNYFSMNEFVLTRTKNSIRIKKNFYDYKNKMSIINYTNEGCFLLNLLMTYIKVSTTSPTCNMTHPALLIMNYLNDQDLLNNSGKTDPQTFYKNDNPYPNTISFFSSAQQIASADKCLISKNLVKNH